jgi:Ca2+-binding EF-hand superfamily protein
MKTIRLVGVLTLAICAAAGPAAAQNADPMVDQASVWDADHNGTYTCDEWKQYASRIFNLADRNHDGSLDATEFKTVQQAAPMLKEADFAYFDDNHDGRVSRNEFVNKPNPLFARYDKNGDCRITPEELKGTATTPGAPQPGKRGLGGGGR